MLGNLFNIVIFTTVIGMLFWISMYILKSMLHLLIPIWMGIVGMCVFILPIIVPQVQLIPAEEQMWYFGYQVAAVIWGIGVITMGIYLFLSYLCVVYSLKKCRICVEDKVLEKTKEICLMYGIKKNPTIFYTDLTIDACVLPLIRPVVLLNKEVLSQLSDRELYIILGHELMHIKRKHHLLRRMFELVVAIQWFNPIVWIAKNNFELICEMDCDRYTISELKDVKSNTYVEAMIHLCEISLGFENKSLSGLKATGKKFIRQRFTAIYQRRESRNYIVQFIIWMILIFILIWSSGKMSSAHFYPYPAFNSAPEYNLDV